MAYSIGRSWPPTERPVPDPPPPDGQRPPTTTAPAPHPVPTIARKTTADPDGSPLQRRSQDHAIPHTCHDIASPGPSMPAKTSRLPLPGVEDEIAWRPFDSRWHYHARPVSA